MSRSLEREFVGRTYDDFLFRPQFGAVATRRGVTLQSWLTKQIAIELPVVSANMDSVTGAAMARRMALEGGVGILHRALSIGAQAEAVRRVKRAQGYVVEEPLCLPRDATIKEAREFTHQHNISGLLIEEQRGSKVLAGLLSNRDLPWSEHFDAEKVERYMTSVERLTTAPPGIPVDEAERLMFERRIEKLPLIDQSRRIRGLVTKKDILLTRRRPYASKDAKGRLLIGAAIGARGDYLERAQELVRAGVDILVIDIAHGHSLVMRAAIEALRARGGQTPLICGNVATADGARFLSELGADAIKVGIGPGRGCRTRLETAAGVPQLHALREAWCAVEEAIPLVADGGVRHDKDIFLALVCGASTVMLGSMLSGTDEAPGRVIEDPTSGEKRKIYRGMTSPQAVLEALYDGGADEVDAPFEAPPEGQEIQIPYQGTVTDIVGRIRGHLRSAVSYGGAASLAEVRAKVLPNPLDYLILLSDAARRESFER